MDLLGFELSLQLLDVAVGRNPHQGNAGADRVDRRHRRWGRRNVASEEGSGVEDQQAFVMENRR